MFVKLSQMLLSQQCASLVLVTHNKLMILATELLLSIYGDVRTLATWTQQTGPHTTSCENFCPRSWSTAAQTSLLLTLSHANKGKSRYLTMNNYGGQRYSENELNRRHVTCPALLWDALTVWESLREDQEDLFITGAVHLCQFKRDGCVVLHQ